MSRNIYDVRRYAKVAFLVVTAVVVAIFLRISSNIVDDLATQERERMQIWADATEQLTASDLNDDAYSDFLLSIIKSNTTIPVLLTDGDGNILDHRNIDLPDAEGVSDANEEYLRGKYYDMRDGSNVIDIDIAEGMRWHLYYEDSKLLKRLSLFPYVQLLVMLAFIAVIYFAVTSTKKAEQNKVWVGLSKETAHQLGTPISSLMAWMELLRAEGVDPDVVNEMNKDVARLSTIASRFSKVGSRPTLEDADLRDVVDGAARYMSTRISSRIKLTVDLSAEGLAVKVSRPLLEWVLENLIKNAVDAMEGSGAIDVTVNRQENQAIIDVRDTGKGIARKRQKTIFNPGYTTKERGWGLGLTLAKRIVEQYHGGKIYVLRSEPGVGTTFRLQLPLTDW